MMMMFFTQMQNPQYGVLYLSTIIGKYLVTCVQRMRLFIITGPVKDSHYNSIYISKLCTGTRVKGKY